MSQLLQEAEFIRKSEDYDYPPRVDRLIENLVAEVERLEKWADSMTDRVLHERKSAEDYQKELNRSIISLRSERDALVKAIQDAMKEFDRITELCNQGKGEDAAVVSYESVWGLEAALAAERTP